MASEPYCAEAPSRSTSTRSIAETGMVLRSTGAEPRPMVPLRFSSEDACRRLPLTSTSTWSGARPRSCAGRMALVPSVRAGRGKLSEGRARASAVASSVVPVACSASLVMMSIGDCDSATVRSLTRVPVTMTLSRLVAGRVSWAWTTAGARTASRARPSGWRGMRNSCGGRGPPRSGGGIFALTPAERVVNPPGSCAWSFCLWNDPQVNSRSRIQRVAIHFSPSVTGAPAWKDIGSVRDWASV